MNERDEEMTLGQQEALWAVQVNCPALFLDQRLSVPFHVPRSASQQPFQSEVLDISFPRNNLNIMGLTSCGSKASSVVFPTDRPTVEWCAHQGY